MSSVQAATSTRRVVFAWSVFAAALAAFAYRGALTDDFTGGDTIALIQTSLIRSLDDLGRVLTQPMLPIITKFYRPTAALSYALDDAVWGFDAFGYHLTDVAIHACVCALIVLVVRRYSASTLAALVAGAAFALHPILMASVPTSTRRHDTLAGLFILLTLLWLPRDDRGKLRALSWIPALAAGALAMGAKEGSILLPALVFALELAVPAPTDSTRPRWLRALRRAAPLLVLAAAFLAWRAWILDGAGGNEHSWKWTLHSLPVLDENACSFFDDLVYPLRVVFHPYSSATDRALALCAALVFFCLIPAILRAWNRPGPEAAGQRLSRALLKVLLIVAGAILLVPAVSPWIRGAVEEAYRNEGWPALARMMDTPRKQPVEFYVWKAFDLALLAATSILLVLAALLAVVWARSRFVSRAEPPRPNLMLFAAAWMAIQLALFLAVQRYHPWYAYVPTIPFCMLLGLGFAEGWRIRRFQAIAFGGLVVWLAAYSPLFRGLDAWRANGRFNTLLMSEIARVAALAPSGSVLEFDDLPNMNRSWQKDGPESSSPFTFNEASLIAWIDRLAPEKDLRVELRSNVLTHWPVAGIRMDSEPFEGKRVVVRAHVLPVQSSDGGAGK